MSDDLVPADPAGVAQRLPAYPPRLERQEEDDWFIAPDGRRFWGLFGAAGMLVRSLRGDGATVYLVVRRAAWVHQGNGLWSIPGGARRRVETARETASREFHEEVGAAPDGLTVIAEHAVVMVAGEWEYVTCVGEVPEPVDWSASLTEEHTDIRWVTRAELMELELFQPFADALPRLLEIYAVADRVRG